MQKMNITKNEKVPVTRNLFCLYPVGQKSPFLDLAYTCLILLSPASQFLPSQTNLYS